MKCKSVLCRYYVEEVVKCDYSDSYVSLGLLRLPHEKIGRVARLDSFMTSSKRAADFVGELCSSHEWEAKEGESAVDRDLRLNLAGRKKQLEKRFDNLTSHYESLLEGSEAIICLVPAGRYCVGQILESLPEEVCELEYLRGTRKI